MSYLLQMVYAQVLVSCQQMINRFQYVYNKKMNSNSRIVTQQNDHTTHPNDDNIRIADIYQKMLSGDKSALSTLQKIKTNSTASHHSNNKNNSRNQHYDQRDLLQEDSHDQQFDQTPRNLLRKGNNNSLAVFKSTEEVQHQSIDDVSQENKKRRNNSYLKSPPKLQNYQRQHPHGQIHDNNGKPINQKTLTDNNHGSLINNNNHLSNLSKVPHQKDQFRSYIKKKVSQLRNQKQLIKSRQMKELGQIGKNVKMNMMTQSKSFDLMNHKNKKNNKDSINNDDRNGKQIGNLSQNQLEGLHKIQKDMEHQMKPLTTKVKAVSAKAHFNKNSNLTHNDHSHSHNHNLPPLVKQKTKIPTETSETNQRGSRSLKHPNNPQLKAMVKPQNLKSKHQFNSKSIQQNPSKRQEVKTPIDLANSNIKITRSKVAQNPPSNSQNQNILSHASHVQHRPPKIGEQRSYPIQASQKQKIMKASQLKSKGKKKQSPKKQSLPQMRQQRQKFALLNEQQKKAQFQLMSHHQQTKMTVERVKNKYELNMKNQQILKAVKSSSQAYNLQPESHKQKTVRSSRITHQSNKNSNSKVHQQQIQRTLIQSKKLSKRQQLQNHIDSIYSDISLLNKMIAEKRAATQKVQYKLSKSLFHQYLLQHNLDSQYEDSFQEEEQQIDQLPSSNLSNSQYHSSNVKSAYSTVMSQTKDKKWSLLKRKQYDTNRSFNQFSKSRQKTSSTSSQVKPSKHHFGNKNNNNNMSKLSNIEQKESLQHQYDEDTMNDDSNGNNKIVVNSRLRNLLY